MSEGTEEDERREAERRGDERREFRDEAGRRDAVRPGRRGRSGRKLRVAIALGVLAVVVLGWRSIVVGPGRLAAAESAQARILVEDLIGEIHLPLLAAPAFGAPGPGDPALGDLSSLLTAAQRAELERIDVRLTPALEAAPRVAGVPEVLGPVRLILGRERDARLAWEALVRVGDERQVGRARVGLAVVAIRAGLRAREEQDARFAFDHAAGQLERVAADHPDARDAAFDLGLIEILGAVDPTSLPEGTAFGAGARPADKVLLEEAAAGGLPRRWTEGAQAPTIEGP